MLQNARLLILMLIPLTHLTARSLAQQHRLQSDTLRVIALLDSAYALESVDSDEALRFYEEARRESGDINYVLGQAKAVHYSGIVHADNSRYDQALKAYRIAVDLYSTIENAKGVGACYANIGNLHKYKGNLDSALVYYHRALSVLERTPHKQALAKTYSNTANLFQGLKQYEKAMEYNRKSEVLAKQIADTSSWCAALVNIGTIWNEMKEYEKAMENQQRAYALAEKIDDTYNKQLATINLADLYKTKGNLEASIQYGLESLQYAQELKSPFDVADIKKRVGDIYLAGKKYDRARELYYEAFQQARQIRAKEITESATRSLHQLYASVDDYENAYRFQTMSQEYADSILSEKQVQIINELDIRYQSAKKDKELAEQQLQLQESKQQAIYSGGAALISILLAVLLFVSYRHKKRLHAQRLLLVENEEEKHVAQALIEGEEKERTRMAHSLHDEVAGILAAVKMNLDVTTSKLDGISRYPEHSKAMVLLDEASTTIRRMAHSLMPDILIQQGLDRALSRYCQALGSGNVVSIQYDSWGERRRFAHNFELAVYRIVQELLNNVIKHARATEALVQLSYTDDSLSITVEDNGVGMHGRDGVKPSNGMGLVSLQTRVSYLYGKMDITTMPGEGVSVHLEFATRSFEVVELDVPT